jgi:molybdate transport system regulatory protein
MVNSAVIRFGIEFAIHPQVGIGKISLLEAIRAAGSLSQAARDLGISYRHAWLLIDSLKFTFREPVTLATRGGRGGGGVALTGFGESLVITYRALERDISELAARRLRSITPMIERGRGSVAVRRPLTIKRKSTVARR